MTSAPSVFPYFALPWHLQRQVLDSLNPLDIESFSIADYEGRLPELQKHRRPRFRKITVRHVAHKKCPQEPDPLNEKTEIYMEKCIEIIFEVENCDISMRVFHSNDCELAVVGRKDLSHNGLHVVEGTVLPNFHEDPKVQDISWAYVNFSVARGKVNHLDISTELMSSRVQLSFPVQRITVRNIDDSLALCKAFRFIGHSFPSNVSLFGVLKSKCSIDLPSISLQFPSTSTLHIRGLEVDLRPGELPKLRSPTIALRTLNCPRYDVMCDLNAMIREWYRGNREIQEIQLLSVDDQTDWSLDVILLGLTYETTGRCGVVKHPVDSKAGLLVTICTKDLLLIRGSNQIVTLLSDATKNLRSCFSIQPPLCIHR